jgi:hypothetical protein
MMLFLTMMFAVAATGAQTIMAKLTAYAALDVDADTWETGKLPVDTMLYGFVF